MARVHVPLIAKPLREDETCERCILHERSKTVCCPTIGPAQSPIFLVGEALGANEENYGRPFVGDAGRKLNYCLHRAGIKRKSLLIGNVCRCRPPGNRTPSKAQIQSCYPYLLYDILKHRPKVIVALGATAFRTLTATIGPTGDLKLGTRSLTHWRGFYEPQTFRWISSKGKELEHTAIVVPAFHPAACLHSWELDDRLVFDFKIAKALARGKEPLKYPDTKVTVARTFDQARALIKRLKRIGIFVTDLETTGLLPHDNRILCAGFCWERGKAHILPLLGRYGKPIWTAAERRVLVEELTDLLEHAGLIGQSLKFDIQHFRKLTGIVDYHIAFDTMIAHHVLDENKPHNLTFMSQWYLGWQKYDEAMAPYQGRFAEAPEETTWTYCGFDVDATFRLRQILAPKIEEDRVRRPYEIELALTVPLADMEYRGIQADRARLEELTVVNRKTAEGLEHRLQILAAKTIGVIKDKKGNPVPFNPRSTPQLTALLLKAGAALKRRTASGKNPSVNKHVMAALALKKNRAGRICRDIQTLRKTTKYLSTYLDGKDGTGGFKAWLRSHDRWHTNYNIAVSRTGRLSADDPPVQTLPRTGGIRSMIIPDQPDLHRLISVDYEKIELCIMAWLANDGVMVKELVSGIDLHTKMAITARLMRDPTDEEFKRMAPTVTGDERAVMGKGVNFGIPYGRGAAAIAEANPGSFPPDMEPYERKQQVQRAINAYFEKYQGVARYRERQVEKMEARGWLRTYVFHRLRRLTGIEWFDSKWGLETEKRDLDRSHLEREAMNFEVQSIASMILNWKTRVVYDAIRKSNIPALRLIMTLHDELVFNCHKDHTEEAIQLIKKSMETKLKRDKRHKYEVPLRVSSTVSRTWDAK